MTGNREKERNEIVDARGDTEPNDGNISLFRPQPMKADTASDVSRGKPARPTRHDDWLRRSLRQLYQDNAKDPIPEAFLKLLEELDRKERDQR